MGIISDWWEKLKTNHTATTPTTSNSQMVASPTPTNQKPKSLADLEAEILAQEDELRVHSTKKIPINSKKRWLKRLVITGIIVAVPTAIVAIANLPVAFWRQAIAQNAPVLLIPTYISLEESFKNGVIALEEARQLIANPTSEQDIQRGQLQLQTAKEYINALPAWFVSDWDRYYTYYHWYWDRYERGRFSPIGFQQARAEIGELEARAFQEANALKVLKQKLQEIEQAKSAYLSGTASADKPLALRTWQTTVTELQLLPPNTLAGRQARQYYELATQDLQQDLQMVAGSNRLNVHITVAQEYAQRGAKMAKNPPYPAERWRQIEQFWQGAIAELNKVPVTDLSNYQTAQKLIAEYKLQLAEVQRRLQSEERGSNFYESAQNKVNKLIANSQNSDRLRIIAQLRQILQDLDKVERGTTIYHKAQELKGYTLSFLKHLETGTKLPPSKR